MEEEPAAGGADVVLDRTEATRLLLQALGDLGYAGAAAALERESGVVLEPPVVRELAAAVLAGDWPRVLALASPAPPSSAHGPSNGSSNGAPAPGLPGLGLGAPALQAVLTQQYLELLHAGDAAGALALLRGRLASLLAPHELHRLAALVAAADPALLLRLGRWEPPAVSRPALLARLRAMMPPAVAVPPRRLQRLATQAWAHQRRACLYHTSRAGGFSLLTDHACGSANLPRAPAASLEGHTDEVWCLAFAPSGRCLASGSRDCTVIVWEVAAAAPGPVPRRVLAGHAQPVSAVAWSPDEAQLASAGLDNTVRLWAPATGACTAVLKRHEDSVVACAWLPDGRHLLSAAHDRTMLLWEAATGRVVHSWTTPARLNDLAVAPDASRVVAVCQEKRIRFFPLPPMGPGAGAFVAEASEEALQESEALTSLCLSADGRYLLVSAVGAAPSVHLWDLRRRALLHKYAGHRQGRFVVRACFAGATEAFVLSGSEDSQVYVWHREQGTLLATLAGHSGTVNALAANPAEPLMFASASDDHAVLLWAAPATAPATAPAPDA